MTSLKELSPLRILRVAEALRHGISEKEIFDASKIDPWFIEQIVDIVFAENRLKESGLPNDKEEFSIYKTLVSQMQGLPLLSAEQKNILETIDMVKRSTLLIKK